MLNAWLRHLYLVSVLFATYGVFFSYKLLTGKILSSSLR
jgi:amino acid permease